MARSKKLSTRQQPEPPAPPPPPQTVAAVDMGASAIRAVIAEVAPGGAPRILEEVSRGVLLGKDTFTSGRIGAATVEAALRALEGFRQIMESYGVTRYRAVATSAVREAANRDGFLDRIRLRTGIEIEVIDGSEENRLTYQAVKEKLEGHEVLASEGALLVEVGGGGADISFLRNGEPIHSGNYALGSIRMRQSLASWRGGNDKRIQLLRRHIHNIVEDIQREMPVSEARDFIALGGDVRFAAAQIGGDARPEGSVPAISRDAFIEFVDRISMQEMDQLIERYRLPVADAETLVPALLAYQELLRLTTAGCILVPDVTLRAGLLLEFAPDREGHGIEDYGRQVLASAAALGEKYHYDAAHARIVAHLATRMFDDLRAEHGLDRRQRLLLEVAAILHDIGNFANVRAHHKHSQYLISVSNVFGLSAEDMAVVSNVARYHRRGTPQKSHLPYMALDRDTRVAVNKMAALLRIANALDVDHVQKIKDVKMVAEEDSWVIEVEAAGELTMERQAALARADLFTEVFGRKVSFREAGMRP
ncbi:MAG: HD domain-containing protein [Acidobacteriota bacterium]